MSFVAIATNATLNSTASVSFVPSMSTFYLVSYLVIMPSVAGIGFLLNIPCLIVLLQPELSGVTYKYLVFKTLCHMTSLLLSSLSPLSNCFTCPVSQSLWVRLYFIYLLKYTANVMFSCAAVVEIALSYDRLLLFKGNSGFFRRISFKTFLIFTSVFGVVVNVPFMLADSAQLIPGTEDRYALVTTAFGLSLFYRVYNILWSLLLSLLSMIIIVILNVFVTIEFKKYIKKKTNMTGKSKDMVSKLKSNNPTSRTKTNQTEVKDELSASIVYSITATNGKTNDSTKNMGKSTSVSGKRDKNESSEKNFTMMILVSSSFYSASRLFSIVNIISTQIYQFMGITAPVFNSYYAVVNFCVTLGYFGTNFFIYLVFNKSFRKCFKKVFCIRKN
jgi:hypothetical protein